MRARTLFRTGALAVTTAALAACAADVTSPPTPRAPRLAVAEGSVPVRGLLRESPLS